LYILLALLLDYLMPRVRKDGEETHLAIVAAPDQAQQNI